MDIFNSRHYKLCTWGLKCIGLWPYQSKKRKLFSILSVTIIQILLCIPQGILLVKKWGDLTISFENPISIVFSFGCWLKYFAASLSKKQFQLLFDKIARDWKEITYKEEIEILEKCADEGNFLVRFYVSYSTLGYLFYTSVCFMPYVIDKMFPLNESRPLIAPFYGDFIFFEQTDYHYWITLYFMLTHVTSLFMVCAVDATYVLTTKHVCGLFSIVCYRMQKIAKTEQDESLPLLLLDKSVKQDLREALILHKDSIRLLEDSYNYAFLLLNILSVIAVAVICVYTLKVRNFVKILRVAAVVLALVIHLFYINWIGQLVVDGSEEVFRSVYENNWYLMDPSLRPLLNIAMARTLKPCRLTAGKFSIICMESFGELLKTTSSYFMVLLSLT